MEKEEILNFNYKNIYNNDKIVNKYVTIDIEATGIPSRTSRIIELAAVKICNGKITDKYHTLVNPNILIDEEIERLTGITNEDVKDAPTFKDVYEEFFDFIDGYIWLGHSIISDYKFLYFEIKFNNFKKNLLKRCDIMSLDTFRISKGLHLKASHRSLVDMCEYFGVANDNVHRAMDDAIATAKVYNELVINYFNEKQELFKPVKLEYHDKSKQKRPVTKKQIRHFNRLKMCHNSNFYDITGKNFDFESLTQSEASRYIDKIILKYGRGNFVNK